MRIARLFVLCAILTAAMALVMPLALPGRANAA